MIPPIPALVPPPWYKCHFNSHPSCRHFVFNLFIYLVLHVWSPFNIEIQLQELFTFPSFLLPRKIVLTPAALYSNVLFFACCPLCLEICPIFHIEGQMRLSLPPSPSQWVPAKPYTKPFTTRSTSWCWFLGALATLPSPGGIWAVSGDT